jgi:hypothetical protein
MILAIDPGTEKSAWIQYDEGRILAMGISPNYELLGDLHNVSALVVIEMIASQGMAVGKTTFETVCWIGRFAEQSCQSIRSFGPKRIYRSDVKLHLCGSMRAKDANIRQALIDRFGPSKGQAIGLKKAPGPLYGVKSHLWAALAVAVTASDRPDLLEDFP